jgi:hypothetical protein
MKSSRPRLAGTGMIRTTLRLTVATVALGALAVLAGVATSARADSSGTINFEPPAYTTGDINGQQTWSKTGTYDVAVANVADFGHAATYGFGTQALRISDQFTTGNFGDQTFAPALSQPAGEATPKRIFSTTFDIGTTLAAVQPGLHMSVSPDNGSGARMSYLRFEDQADGVHVFFSGVSDPGPDYTVADFSDVDIATLDRATAHTVNLSIHFIPGPANDVVTVTIDGVLKKTGSSWEDYYRYDNENQGGIQPPSVSTMLFRESGMAHSDNAGYGFLVDNLSYESTTPTCTPTGFFRDGINMTAAQIGGNVSGLLDATGCNIGVYYDSTHTGNVTAGSNIYGANYFGVVVNGDNGAVTTNVRGSSIHDIGETPLDGTQHGTAIYYRAFGTGSSATGIIAGNTIAHYQKGGITVGGNVSATIQNNTVTGEGPVSYIAQNGIQMGYGAKGSVTGNTVTRNAYTGAGQTSSAGILVVGGPCFGLPYTTGLTISRNTVRNNDVGVWLFNANESCVAGTIKTNNAVKLNTITNTAVTNTTGYSATCGYQAGVADVGHRDAIVNNTISGTGYAPIDGDCAGTPQAFVRHVDLDSSARAKPSNK